MKTARSGTVSYTHLDVYKRQVRGLRAGAYDYISKPFAPEELLARVDGLMRHTGRLGPGMSVWGVEIDRARRTVARNGEPVRLTPREFDLMMMLVRNRGIALYRDVLLGEVWGDECPESTRTLDIHISRLRRKLGWKHCLISVPGVEMCIRDSRGTARTGCRRKRCRGAQGGDAGGTVQGAVHLFRPPCGLL